MKAPVSALLPVLLAACPNEGGMTDPATTDTTGTSTAASDEAGTNVATGADTGTTDPSTTTTTSLDTGTTGPVDACTPGEVEACYGGPRGTADVGLCAAGERTCDAEGSWGACAGEVLPATEDCGSLGDEDCDGVDGCAANYPWSKTFGGIEWERTEGVGFDGAGNVVLMIAASGKSVIDVGGGPLPGDGGLDTTLARFAPDGTHLWSTRLPAQFPDQTQGHDLAVHADGRIAVTGSFSGDLDFGGGPIAAQSFLDGFIAVLHPDGSELWSAPLRAGSEIYPYSIAFAVDGGVAIAGHAQGWVDLGGGPLPGAGENDAFVGRYAADGTHLWSRRFGDGVEQWAFAVTIDAEGATYVGGHFEGKIDLGGGPLVSAGFTDVFLGVFDLQGAPLWNKRWGGPFDDHIYNLSLDGQGRMALGGFTSGGIDFGGGPLPGDNSLAPYLAVLDTAGTHVWSRRFDKSVSPQEVVYDGAGALVLAGSFHGSVDFGGGPLLDAGKGDLFVAKLSGAGEHLWSARHGSPDYEYPACAAASAAGVVAIGGMLEGVVDFGDGPHPKADAFGQGFVAVFAP